MRYSWGSGVRREEKGTRPGKGEISGLTLQGSLEQKLYLRPHPTWRKRSWNFIHESVIGFSGWRGDSQALWLSIQGGSYSSQTHSPKEGPKWEEFRVKEQALVVIEMWENLWLPLCHRLDVRQHMQSMDLKLSFIQSAFSTYILNFYCVPRTAQWAGDEWCKEVGMMTVLLVSRAGHAMGWGRHWSAWERWSWTRQGWA